MGQYYTKTNEEQNNAQLDKLKFKIYNDDKEIGYIESFMNKLIFVPPYMDEISNIPNWLRYLNIGNGKKISYFIIDPIPVNKNSKGKTKYILWSHGNASNLISLYPMMLQLYNAMEGKIGIIGYDYQGYGYSDGYCSEINCYNDITMIIKHLIVVKGIKKNNIFLFGHSLGTGIVVDFCSRHTWFVNPIVLLSPYKSIARVKIDPGTWDPVSNLFIDYMDMFTTHYKIDNLKCPIIIYHGVKDELIDPSHSIDMYEKHKDKITLVLLKNATHNDLISHINPQQISDIIFNSF